MSPGHSSTAPRHANAHGSTGRPNDPSPRDEILFVTDRRFWRRSIGSEQRIAALVENFAERGHRVAVAYVGKTTQDDRASLAAFRSSMTNLETITRDDRPIDFGFRIRRLIERLGNRRDANKREDPHSILATRSPRRRAFVQTVIDDRQPRIVIVEFLRLTYTVHPRDAVPGNRRRPMYWIDTHDVLHQRAESFRAAGAAVQADVDEEDEARALASYDAIVAIHEPDGETFRKLLPETSVLVVPHGISLPTNSEPAASRATAACARSPWRLGFLGGRDESNLRALDWFVAELWPDLRTKFGRGVELHIAGQVCHEWKRRLDGVVHWGPLDSIDRFWPNIEIAINPIRYGSGLKIKNVEALAYGVPLLTTSVGALGLEPAMSHGLRVADQRDEWLETLCDWLDNPSHALEVGLAGHAYANAHLTKEAVFRDLETALAVGRE